MDLVDEIDIDEMAKDDSFYLPFDRNEDEVKNILQQWKSNNLSSINVSPKFVDTRTFTRPKKRHVNNNLEMAFQNFALAEEPVTATVTAPAPLPAPASASAQYQQPVVNLKIGGLVTNMQKSFLNDTSPPNTLSASIDLSAERMDNSLITSGDFTNVSFLDTNTVETDEIGAESNFNEYGLDDVIRDRKFFENLYLLDDQMLTKDASISKTDINGFLCNSNNSTLQNSAEFSLSKDFLNEIFVQEEANKNIINGAINSTFNLDTTTVDVFSRPAIVDPQTVNVLVNETFVQAEIKPSFNSTFDVNLVAASELQHNNETYVAIANATANQTFEQLSPTKNCTVTISHKTIENSYKKEHEDEREHEEEVVLRNHVVMSTQKQPKNIAQSTPSKSTKTIISIPSLDLSPIFEENNQSKCRKTEQELIHCITPKAEDLDNFFKEKSKQLSEMAQQSGDKNTTLHYLREDERQSLNNFEEFEKSMYDFEQNHNEKEFDAMLNELGSSNARLSNERMRVSLDHIKKRHSFINYEKQQEELKQRKDAQPCDSNKLNDSLVLLSQSLTASGSERLLNRRSRMFDDMKNSSPNTPSDQHLESDQSQIVAEEEPTIAVNDTKPEKPNRDRFKTMRIFRKADEQIQLPNVDDDDSNNKNTAEPLPQLQLLPSSEAFVKRDHNSPVLEPAFKEPFPPEGRNENKDRDPRKRSLSKPRFFSGLGQPAKSSSVDSLDRNSSDRNAEIIEQNQTAIKASLKNSMGSKSKSIHNLLGNNAASSIRSGFQMRPASKISLQSGVKKADDPKLSIPGRMPRPLSLIRPSTVSNVQVDNKSLEFESAQPPSNLRAPSARRTGLLRPQSGHYSLSMANARRNDMDTESGRCSPNSLSSSSSSKDGSIGTNSKSIMLSNNATINVHSKYAKNDQGVNTLPIVAQAPLKPVAPVNVRPSGIRPPSGLRPPQIKTGLPRLTSIPRR